jgi:hypothetical protein
MNNNNSKSNQSQGVNHPAKHFKFGAVRVTLWKDERKGPTGQGFDSWSVTIDRAYRDAKGVWQNTGSLRENDIPKAVAALEKAYAHIMERAVFPMKLSGEGRKWPGFRSRHSPSSFPVPHCPVASQGKDI